MQVFAANLGVRGGSTAPSTPTYYPDGPANKELGIWANLLNVTPDSAIDNLAKSGGRSSDFNGQAMLNKRIPAGSPPGMVVAIDTVTRPSTDKAVVIGFSKVPHTTTASTTDSIDYCLFWNNTNVRVFDNTNSSNPLVKQIDFTDATANFSFEAHADGLYFYQNGAGIAHITADTSINAFISVAMAVIGTQCPPVHVTTGSFLNYSLQ